MRYSKQRELVMQTVQQLCDHPTAEEIYDKAAQECPNLSLGTVYRNLNSLVEAGRVRRVSIPGKADRFDHTLPWHLEHCLDIPGAAGGAVELMESHPAVLGDDAGHGGLARAGRAVEDHVGDAAALDGAAEHPPRSQQMLLPAHIRQRFGTQALRKWFIHGGFSFPARKALFI